MVISSETVNVKLTISLAANQHLTTVTEALLLSDSDDVAEQQQPGSLQLT